MTTPHLLVAARTADIDTPVLPRGAQHDVCAECLSVVVLMGGHLSVQLECMLSGQPTRVLCLECAAIESPKLRQIYQALYGREPEDARRAPAIQ